MALRCIVFDCMAAICHTLHHDSLVNGIYGNTICYYDRDVFLLPPLKAAFQTKLNTD